jgi:hypothetical protein
MASAAPMIPYNHRTPFLVLMHRRLFGQMLQRIITHAVCGLNSVHY